MAFPKGHVPYNKGKSHSSLTKTKIKHALTGRKRTLETKNKMSLSRKGRVFSKETREKIGLSNKGKKRTPEQIEKNRLGHLGLKSSIETRIKIGRYWKGDKNPNWKGGITPINLAIRESFNYRLWRSRVYERDSWTCQTCGVIGGKLHAHHIKSFADYPETRFELENGVTLCVECHKLTDNFGFRNRTHKISC